MSIGSAVDVARGAVGAAQAVLNGAEFNGARVDALFHYGAVDIEPRHLVVWILLSGKPDDQLPQWLAVAPDATTPETITTPDYRWLQTLRAEIVWQFAAVGWPLPQRISVYADSAQRVANGGGWSYFRG